MDTDHISALDTRTLLLERCFFVGFLCRKMPYSFPLLSANLSPHNFRCSRGSACLVPMRHASATTIARRSHKNTCQCEQRAMDRGDATTDNAVSERRRTSL